MDERDFKGIWIPKEVWLDGNLTMLEKGIFAEIDSLDAGENGCWASNEYLANFCKCSVTKVSCAISKLAEIGYLKVESFDGRRRKIKSRLSFFKEQPYKNCKADLQIVKESNIPKNIKNKSTTRKRSDDDIPVGFDDFWAVYPRKAAKQNAVKAWKKTGASDSKALKETIIEDVKRRTKSEWKDKDVQYIPHPATYLNQRRWEDEPVIQEDEYKPTFQELLNQKLKERGGDSYVPGFDKPLGVD